MRLELHRMFSRCGSNTERHVLKRGMHKTINRLKLTSVVAVAQTTWLHIELRLPRFK